ncbi:cyclic nucleotide-gated ion channel 17 [Canna indica]|uniref:Cyclic nucleotide-gated ion channel 17 n=1 Tax=Canna indica TaxID=4628 RepID=A0AAQ3L6P4_9LILI|nr:cyclic nucleotide-gated ion channel 17 [Canna indica]
MFALTRVDDERELKKERAVRFFPDEKQNPAKNTYHGYVNSKGGNTTWKSIVFAEDHEPWRKRIFDPGSEIVSKWNRIFLFSCLVALFIDPLYFYLPKVETSNSICIRMDETVSVVVTILRSFADLFYILHIAIKFRIAYVAPSSRVFGRGELVMDPKQIAMRYLRSDFIIDLAAALPLPQILIWSAIRNSRADHNNNALALIVLIQYIPRLYLIFPLVYQIVKVDGVVTKTAWAGAAYNLLLYMIASHVIGASWYLISIERQTSCWKNQCGEEKNCNTRYLDCSSLRMSTRDNWASQTRVFNNCDASNKTIDFNYGIFQSALTTGAVSTAFIKKYFYCLWWGLQNLSSYGQTLQTSTFVGETLFAILIAIIGLVLFALLIGNMQTYLQSLTVRLEEWRLKREDTEEWMCHRQLPNDLRGRVRRFMQYKWLATQGVDEESILRSLPADLRRDIQRHLCLDLVRRVPFFSQMDDQLLDAICERLVSSLYTEGTYIVREGDPVTEMLFIIRGRLESSTTNGGRTGFFNCTILRPGDFCGEELLSWALLSKAVVNLPSSTRTVRALVEVEAFALRAEDLKFVANQFRRLHSKKLQHTFRYYSHHWRTWAACFIQAAWHRHKRRQFARELLMRESFNSQTDEQSTDETRHEEDEPATHFASSSQAKETSLSSKFAAATRKGVQKMKGMGMLKMQKPDEPDFSADPYD